LALLDDIVDYRTNEKEIIMEDGRVTTSMGTKRKKETTTGWELLLVERWQYNVGDAQGRQGIKSLSLR
jgi:hypothetical protein